MVKRYLLTLSLSLFASLHAEELELKNSNFIIENDADVRTDEAYSHGAKLSLLYLRKNHSNSFFHIPFSEVDRGDHYLSLSYSQQLYTPSDIENTQLVTDDRPYAGYMNIQAALHHSLENRLQSLTLQIGLVGPSAQMEAVQEFVHGLIGSPMPQGWEHQIDDEFIFQLNYAEKIYFDAGKLFSLDSILIPEYGFELGNASTKLYAGTLWRLGWGVPQDYGTFAIDNHSYSKIPLKTSSIEYKKEWAFSFNFGMRVNAIARDIFLDGNSNGQSHSVEKKNFVVEGTYGFSLIYENMSFDYTRTQSSKEFKGQSNYLGYGSLEFSYNF